MLFVTSQHQLVLLQGSTQDAGYASAQGWVLRASNDKA